MREPCGSLLCNQVYRGAAAGDARGWRDGSGTLPVQGVSRLLHRGQRAVVGILAGMILLAPLPAARAGVVKADTLTVTADREQTAAIIREVGRRMRAADLRAAPYAYTVTSTRTDYYGPTDSTGVTVVTLTVARNLRRPGGSVRTLTLSTRTRRFEDGELKSEEIRDGVGPVGWREASRPLLRDLPFMPGAADRYDYRVLESRLVGNTVIYRIAFGPRNAFDALPSGEVWVDYGGWILRRLQARMTGGPTPTALLKAVPLYSLKQERRSGLWLPVDIRLVMDLRPVPLMHLPRRVELRTTISDVEVRGVIDPAHAALTADPRDTTEFWLPAQAAADSLAAFWARVDGAAPAGAAQEMPVWPGLEAPDDSLLAVADHRLTLAGKDERRWRCAVHPAVRGFNRAQGLTPQIVLKGAPRVDRALAMRLALGLGTADGREEGHGSLGQSLTADHPWGWRVAAWSEARAFVAADRPLRSVAALVYGADPRAFIREQAVGMGVRRDMGAGWRVGLGLEAFRQRPLTPRVTWNPAGKVTEADDWVMGDPVQGRRWRAEVTGLWAGIPLDFGADRWQVAGRRGRWRLQAGLRWRGHDGQGNDWRLGLGYRRWTGPGPLQEQFWLGGWQPAGGLPGWPAGRMRGNTALQGAVEARLSADPWRAVGFPVLKNLHLQPVLAVGVGLTRDGGLWNPETGDPGAIGGEVPAVGAATPTGPLGSLAVGFQRLLGLPVLGDKPHLRLLAAWPLGPGARQSGMRIVAGLVE